MKTSHLDWNVLNSENRLIIDSKNRLIIYYYINY